MLMVYFLKLIKSMKMREQIAFLFIIFLLLFLLSGCGYTQLKMPAFKFKPVNDREHSLIENYYDKEQEPEFTPMVGKFKRDINMYYPNYNIQYYPYGSYYHNGFFSFQRHGINNMVYYPYIETDLRIREQIVKENVETPIVTKPVNNQLKREIWQRRINPRHRKKVPATRRELEKTDASD